ncbi:hypothetical protein CNE_BB1p09730 (plasmid) [Cupriavidus necator N-1]|uniref:Uncharacterized protein n=1 Tax=Cupriavidus necator (strain ATCC 43291 / DSM 13513 / CCUG 52238 / LMG 8453 / N-1) TaxID=1042878 RepID=F8GUI0_CUPNN|nr:hypothetical protein CNE_BB1p09730 [Cupriavidus necator N-1]
MRKDCRTSLSFMKKWMAQVPYRLLQAQSHLDRDGGEVLTGHIGYGSERVTID